MGFKLSDIPFVEEYLRDNPEDTRDVRDIILDFGRNIPQLRETDPVFNEIYEKVRDANTDDVATSAGKGLLRGIDITQATLFGAAGLAGEAIGSDAIRDFGQEGFKNNIIESQENAATTSYDDLKDDFNLTGAVDFVASTVGEVFPSIASTLAGGAGFGTAFANLATKKAVSNAVKKKVIKELQAEIAKEGGERLSKQAIRQRAEERIEEELQKEITARLAVNAQAKEGVQRVTKGQAEKAAAKSQEKVGRKELFRRGANVGATFSSIAQNSGEVYGGFVDESDNPNITSGERVLLSTIGGVLAGLLDSVLPKAALSRLSPQQKTGMLDSMVKKYKDFAKEKPTLATAFLAPTVGAVGEGGTEALQEFISFSARNIADESTDFSWDEVLPILEEAGVKGAVGGGGLGFAFGASQALADEGQRKADKKVREKAEEAALNRSENLRVHQIDKFKRHNEKTVEEKAEASNPEDVPTPTDSMAAFRVREAEDLSNIFARGELTEDQKERLDKLNVIYEGKDPQENKIAGILKSGRERRLADIALKVVNGERLNAKDTNDLEELSEEFPEEAADIQANLDAVNTRRKDPVSTESKDEDIPTGQLDMFNVPVDSEVQEYRKLINREDKLSRKEAVRRGKLKKEHDVTIKKELERMDELLSKLGNEDAGFNQNFTEDDFRELQRLRRLHPKLGKEIEQRHEDVKDADLVTKANLAQGDLKFISREDLEKKSITQLLDGIPFVNTGVGRTKADRGKKLTDKEIEAVISKEELIDAIYNNQNVPTSEVVNARLRRARLKKQAESGTKTNPAKGIQDLLRLSGIENPKILTDQGVDVDTDLLLDSLLEPNPESEKQMERLKDIHDRTNNLAKVRKLKPAGLIKLLSNEKNFDGAELRERGFSLEQLQTLALLDGERLEDLRDKLNLTYRRNRESESTGQLQSEILSEGQTVETNFQEGGDQDQLVDSILLVEDAQEALYERGDLAYSPEFEQMNVEELVQRRGEIENEAASIAEELETLRVSLDTIAGLPSEQTNANNISNRIAKLERAQDKVGGKLAGIDLFLLANNLLSEVPPTLLVEGAEQFIADSVPYLGATRFFGEPLGGVEAPYDVSTLTPALSDAVNRIQVQRGNDGRRIEVAEQEESSTEAGITEEDFQEEQEKTPQDSGSVPDPVIAGTKMTVDFYTGPELSDMGALAERDIQEDPTNGGRKELTDVVAQAIEDGKLSQEDVTIELTPRALSYIQGPLKRLATASETDSVVEGVTVATSREDARVRNMISTHVRDKGGPTISVTEIRNDNTGIPTIVATKDLVADPDVALSQLQEVTPKKNKVRMFVAVDVDGVVEVRGITYAGGKYRVTRGLDLTNAAKAIKTPIGKVRSALDSDIQKVRNDMLKELHSVGYDPNAYVDGNRKLSLDEFLKSGRPLKAMVARDSLPANSLSNYRMSYDGFGIYKNHVQQDLKALASSFAMTDGGDSLIKILLRKVASTEMDTKGKKKINPVSNRSNLRGIDRILSSRNDMQTGEEDMTLSSDETLNSQAVKDYARRSTVVHFINDLVEIASRRAPAIFSPKETRTLMLGLLNTSTVAEENLKRVLNEPADGVYSLLRVVDDNGRYFGLFTRKQMERMFAESDSKGRSMEEVILDTIEGDPALSLEEFNRQIQNRMAVGNRIESNREVSLNRTVSLDEFLKNEIAEGDAATQALLDDLEQPETIPLTPDENVLFAAMPGDGRIAPNVIVNRDGVYQLDQSYFNKLRSRVDFLLEGEGEARIQFLDVNNTEYRSRIVTQAITDVGLTEVIMRSSIVSGLVKELMFQSGEQVRFREIVKKNGGDEAKAVLEFMAVSDTVKPEVVQRVVTEKIAEAYEQANIIRDSSIESDPSGDILSAGGTGSLEFEGGISAEAGSTEPTTNGEADVGTAVAKATRGSRGTEINRDNFKELAVEKFKMSPGDAEVLVTLMDNVAYVWATANGRLPSEWYTENFEGIIDTDELTDAELESIQREDPEAFQKAQGVTGFGNTGKALVVAFESADATTFLHELGHVIRRTSLTPAQQNLIAQGLSDIKPAQGEVVPEGALNRGQEEAFAEAWEAYFVTKAGTKRGRSPIPQLETLFDSMYHWANRAYTGVERSHLKGQGLQMFGIFDQLFVGTDKPDAPLTKHQAKLKQDLEVARRQTRSAASTIEDSKRLKNEANMMRERRMAAAAELMIDQKNKAFEALVRVFNPTVRGEGKVLSDTALVFEDVTSFNLFYGMIVKAIDDQVSSKLRRISSAELLAAQDVPVAQASELAGRAFNQVFQQLEELAVNPEEVAQELGISFDIKELNRKKKSLQSAKRKGDLLALSPTQRGDVTQTQDELELKATLDNAGTILRNEEDKQLEKAFGDAIAAKEKELAAWGRAQESKSKSLFTKAEKDAIEGKPKAGGAQTKFQNRLYVKHIQELKADIDLLKDDFANRNLKSDGLTKKVSEAGLKVMRKFIRNANIPVPPQTKRKINKQVKALRDGYFDSNIRTIDDLIAMKKDADKGNRAVSIGFNVPEIGGVRFGKSKTQRRKRVAEFTEEGAELSTGVSGDAIIEGEEVEFGGTSLGTEQFGDGPRLKTFYLDRLVEITTPLTRRFNVEFDSKKPAIDFVDRIGAHERSEAFVFAGELRVDVAGKEPVLISRDDNGRVNSVAFLATSNNLDTYEVMVVATEDMTKSERASAKAERTMLAMLEIVRDNWLAETTQLGLESKMRIQVVNTSKTKFTNDLQALGFTRLTKNNQLWESRNTETQVSRRQARKELGSERVKQLEQSSFAQKVKRLFRGRTVEQRPAPELPGFEVSADGLIRINEDNLLKEDLDGLVEAIVVRGPNAVVVDPTNGRSDTLTKLQKMVGDAFPVPSIHPSEEPGNTSMPDGPDWLFQTRQPDRSDFDNGDSDSGVTSPLGETINSKDENGEPVVHHNTDAPETAQALINGIDLRRNDVTATESYGAQKIAYYKEFAQIIQPLFDNPAFAGVDLAGFLRRIGFKGDLVENIQMLQQEYPQVANATMEGLNDSQKTEANLSLLKMLNNLKSRSIKRRARMQKDIDTFGEQHNKLYPGRDSTMVQPANMETFNSNLKSFLKQIKENLHEYVDLTVASNSMAAVLDALQKLPGRKITANEVADVVSGRVDILELTQAVSALGIDWKTISSEDAINLLDNPSLAPLIKDLAPGKKRGIEAKLLEIANDDALKAFVIAYGKERTFEMTTLENSIADTQGRYQDIKDALKEANNKGPAGIDKTIREIEEGIKNLQRSDKLRLQILEYQRRYEKSQERMENAKKEIQMIEEAIIALRQGEEGPRNVLQVTDYFDGSPNSEFVEMDPNVDGFVQKAVHQFSPSTDRTALADYRTAFITNVQWLEKNADLQNVTKSQYESVQRMNDRLGMSIMYKDSVDAKRNFATKRLQSFTDRFRDMGLDSTSMLSGLITQWQAEFQKWNNELEFKAQKWESSSRQLTSLAGYGRKADRFKRDILTPLYSFIKTETGISNMETLTNETYRRLLNMVAEHNGVVVGTIDTPQFRKVWTDYVMQVSEFTETLDRIRQESGIPIEDQRIMVDQLEDLYYMNPAAKEQARVSGKRVPIQRIESVKKGLITVPQSVDFAGINALLQHMREKASWYVKGQDGETPFYFWEQINPETREIDGNIFNSFLQDDSKTRDEKIEFVRAAFAGQLDPSESAKVDDVVISEFLEPLVYHHTSQFNGVSEAEVAAIWEQNADQIRETKDITPFLVELAELGKGELAFDENLNKHVNSIIRLFKTYVSVGVEAQKSTDQFDHRIQNHFIVDARIADDIPDIYLSYADFSKQAVSGYIAKLMSIKYFGKNFSTFNGLIGGDNSEAMRQIASRRSDAALRGDDSEVQKLDELREDIRDLRNRFLDWFSGNESGPNKDARLMSEIVGLSVTGTISTVTTGLMNLVTPITNFAFVFGGLNGLTGTGMKGVVQALTTAPFRSLMEMLGIYSGGGSEVNRQVSEMAYSLMKQDVSFMEELAETGVGTELEAGPAATFIRSARAVKRMSTHPLPTLRPVWEWLGIAEKGGRRTAALPSLNAFDFINRIANYAATMGMVKMYGELFTKLIDATPGVDFRDPSFKFSDMNVRELGINDDTFRLMEARAQEFGLPLELWVSNVRERRANGEPDFDQNELVALHSMAISKINLESNVTSRAVAVSEHPVLSTLIGWSLSQTLTVGNALTDQEGNYSARLFTKFLASSMFAVGVGLAFSELKDEYNFIFRNRVPRQRKLSQAEDFGDLVEITAERTVAGGAFGMGGDVALRLFTGFIDAPGDRVSFDDRIYVFNMMKNMYEGIMDIRRQKGISFETSGQKLMRAMGGNAFLQASETVLAFAPDAADEVPLIGPSILAPLKGQIKKLNSNAMIAGAARSLDIPVKQAFSGATSDEVTRHVKRMQIAALNDDKAEFNRAYKSAIQAAIDMKKEDPIKTVKDRWGGRNPLFLIQSQSEAKRNLNRMLQNIPAEYRQSVIESLNQYEEYSRTIGAPGNFGSSRSSTTEADLTRKVFQSATRSSGGSAFSGLRGLRGL